MEIDYPSAPKEKVELMKAIQDKVTDDGSSGELVTFNGAQHIDWATNILKGEAALINEKSYGINIRAGKKNNEKAQIKIAIAMTAAHLIAGELKALNAPKYKACSLWGFTISPTGAFKFPVTFEDKCTLWKNIKKKYDTYPPGDAPIENFIIAKEIDMDAISTLVIEAQTYKDDADQHHLDALMDTESRNKNMAQGELDCHKTGDYLQLRHKADGRVLGDYGFTTTDAPALQYFQISSVPMGGEKSLQHIVLDSTMTNMENFDMIVHKGIKKRGLGVVLKAFGELQMTKGYSKCILESKNKLKLGLVKVKVHR